MVDIFYLCQQKTYYLFTAQLVFRPNQCAQCALEVIDELIMEGCYCILSLAVAGITEKGVCEICE